MKTSRLNNRRKLSNYLVLTDDFLKVFFIMIAFTFNYSHHTFVASEELLNALPALKEFVHPLL